MLTMVILLKIFIVIIISILPIVFAATHEFNWTLSIITANPDGEQERPVIAINDAFPLPLIRINQNDRVVINLLNNLNESTSLHFHGIFQKGASFMDGASMITQCPIPPGESFQYDFTVDQVGTYWYHSHDAAQYSDGFRGAFIVDPSEKSYDDDFVVMLSDWYHTPSSKLVKELFTTESHGREPRIDSWLFNETSGTDIYVEKDKSYLIRLINVGMSASQFFYIDDHKLTIVEIDGVEIEPTEVETVRLSSGQRVSVLLKAKDEDDTNYGVVQATNIGMHKKFGITWLIYNKDAENKNVVPNKDKLKNIVNDLDLKPKDKIAALGKPDHELTMEFTSEYYTPNRIRYYSLNGQPHLEPKVPTLNTVFSANSTTVNNAIIYGEATNALILKKGEIVQIVINSYDHMRHPFHLHGHNFQVLARGSREFFDNNTDSFPKYPVIRDTIDVLGRGYVVLRFIADNPGVWFFHCHVEWHAVQGLGVVFIEAPEEILENQKLPMRFEDICKVGGIKPKGNAAGNMDLFDLEGEVKMLNKYQTTTIPTPLPTSTPTATNKPEPKITKLSIKQQGKVLAVYFSIMITIAGIAAYYLNRNNMKNKRRKLQRINLRDNYEMQPISK